MIVDVAAILVAVAFAILVGYLVPLLVQIRKTAAEAEQLVTKLNSELPTLVAELRTMSHSLNDVAEQARDGVEHAAVLLHALGDVGDSVNQVHQLVKGVGRFALGSCGQCVCRFESGETCGYRTIQRGRALPWRSMKVHRQRPCCWAF